MGRNETLFRTLMRESGKPSNWGKDLLPLALSVADALRDSVPSDHPFTTAEVRACAASVMRYQRRNLSSGRTQAGFSRLQAERGRRSGIARRRDSFESAKPWVDEGISRRTWYSRRRSGSPPPPPSRESLKPWVAEGISRRTWYNRLRKARREASA